jgi:mRNA-degrading endonuclease RelE of RelBE toxin-antitoxin system
MNWRLLVSKSAQKELSNLPGKDQLRVEAALDALQRDSFSGDVKRLRARRMAQACRQLQDILRPPT